MPREYKVFRTERKGPVFWVVMTNTKKRNSMGIDFWAELPQVFAEAAADDDADQPRDEGPNRMLGVILGFAYHFQPPAASPGTRWEGRWRDRSRNVPPASP